MSNGRRHILIQKLKSILNNRKIIIILVILAILLGIHHFAVIIYTHGFAKHSARINLSSQTTHIPSSTGKTTKFSAPSNEPMAIIVPRLKNPPKKRDRLLDQLINISTVKLDECPDGRYSRYLPVILQREWETNETVVENDENSSIPLIIYGPTWEIFHKINTSGCRYKCRYSTKSEDYEKATLAVYTRYWSKEFVTRNDSKMWAFETNESPLHTRMPPPSVESKFSIFVTTSTDSLVPWVYGLFLPFQRPHCLISDETRELMSKEDSTKFLPAHHKLRNNSIACVISNRDGTQRREEKYKELTSFIKIDRYGAGYRPCGKVLDATCFQNLSLNYKFLLAFENSYCSEYITEKLFKNALSNGMVPIVYGAPSDDYFHLAPPNSYIHVDDFNTVKELSEYIKYLDRNDTAYATYFAWKKYGFLAKKSRVDCRLCGVLHNILNGRLETQKDQFARFNNRSKLCL